MSKTYKTMQLVQLTYDNNSQKYFAVTEENLQYMKNVESTAKDMIIFNPDGSRYNNFSLHVESLGDIQVEC